MKYDVGLTWGGGRMGASVVWHPTIPAEDCVTGLRSGLGAFRLRFPEDWPIGLGSRRCHPRLQSGRRCRESRVSMRLFEKKKKEEKNNKEAIRETM